MSAAARESVTDAAARADAACERLDQQIAALLDPKRPRALRSERIVRRAPTADVLLVEDDIFAPDMVGLLRDQLPGVTVRLAQRADDALDLATRGVWRVAVLDLHLGHARITGLDVLAALSSETRVVLVTGVAPTELPQIAREARVDAHMTKPFAPDALARVVADLLTPAEALHP